METHTTALPAGAAKTDLEIARQNTAAIKTRLAQFCAWFELTPPRLKVARTGVCVTDDLADWVQSVGISWDWLILGDLHEMAKAFRQANVPLDEARRHLAAMTDEQKRLFLIGMRSYVDGVVSFDDAMAGIKAMMEPKNEAAAGVGQASSEIDRLFDEWVAARDDFNRNGFEGDDAVDCAPATALRELERQICCIPSQTPADLAKKLYAFHSGTIVNDAGPGLAELRAEIKALTGMEAD